MSFVHLQSLADGSVFSVLDLHLILGLCVGALLWVLDFLDCNHKQSLSNYLEITSNGELLVGLP